MSAFSSVSFRAAAALFLLFASVGAAGATTWTLETINSTLEPQPSLALDAAGAPWVAHNFGAQPSVALRLGGSWVLENLVTPQAEALTAAPPQLDLIYFVVPSLAFGATDGEPRLLYHKAPQSEVWFATRAAGIWSYQRLSGNAAGPALQMDATGTAHAAFYNYTLGPRYGRLDPGGWTFESAPGSGRLAVDVAGRPSIAYVPGATGDAVRWARREASGWVVEICEAVAATDVSLAVDGAGEPHVVFADHPNQRVRYARRTSGVWTVETVASGVGQWFSTAIALGAGGEPFVVYYDRVGNNFCFARRSAGVWSHETVEASYAPHGCSIAIDAAGRPHLAYFTTGSNLVRYATTGQSVTDVAPGASATGFALASAAPNPLRAGGALELALRLDAPRHVTVEMFDMAGRRVEAREPEELGAGAQILRWSPRVAGSGLYFVSVRSERGERLVTRVAVVR